jgi:hypothetical protein
MPEANSAPILSTPPSRLPTLAPDPAQKPKLLNRLCEALRSRHYSPRPNFRHGLFNITHVDPFGPETPSPLAPHPCSQPWPARCSQPCGRALRFRKRGFSRISIRRHDKKQQGVQVFDIKWIIAAIFAVLTAYYTDRKPIFRILCGSS